MEHLDDEQLSRSHSPIMSPLVWDLAHIAAYEDLWLAHRHGGLPLSRPELAEMYDAFETPRAARAELELLGPAQARDYLQEVRSHTAEALGKEGVGDGVLYEMVLRHELQHTETMRQTMELAGLLPEGEPPLDRLAQQSAAQQSPADDVAARVSPDAPGYWIEVPAGEFEMGAVPGVFSYDNERPRHAVELPPFQIARHPVCNASWSQFVRDGGYERSELWSRDGWTWKTAEGALAPSSVATGHPHAPVCHVSWFEAEAFACFAGARLPSEPEWERAASSLEDAGQVWEWVGSSFYGYPGFVAHPYREYSEVFFGGDYRVLRGGSWATSPCVATRTFRNWDHPYRRQIFAGVRLARDAGA